MLELAKCQFRLISKLRSGVGWGGVEHMNEGVCLEKIVFNKMTAVRT